MHRLGEICYQENSFWSCGSRKQKWNDKKKVQIREAPYFHKNNFCSAIKSVVSAWLSLETHLCTTKHMSLYRLAGFPSWNDAWILSLVLLPILAKCMPRMNPGLKSQVLKALHLLTLCVCVCVCVCVNYANLNPKDTPSLILPSSKEIYLSQNIEIPIVRFQRHFMQNTLRFCL
jgi:hypothetical protein